MFQMCLLLVIVAPILGFNFRAISMSCDSNVINTNTTCYFFYERSSDNSLDNTAWETEPVSSAANITLTFPIDYTLDNPTCLQVTVNSQAINSADYTCSSSGNTITIQNAFTSVSNLSIYDVELTIGDVLNPSPALTTGEFKGQIGDDIAVPDGVGYQLAPSVFDSCYITFDPAYVNQHNTMVFTLDPKNQLTSSGSIVITLPRQWTNDITDTDLPLSNTMSCVNRTSSISSSIICEGNTGDFTLTATSIFTSTISDEFSFGMENFLSPPTLQKSDLIYITSYEGSYEVDTCSAYVSDLLPSQFTSLTIEPIDDMVVNTVVGLKFTMVLSDLVNQDDQFQITFPDGLTVSYHSVQLSGSFQAASITGQVLDIQQDTNRARNFSQDSTYIIKFYNFTAPPSTLTTDPIVVTITKNSYAKMTGSASVQASASTLSGDVSAAISTVWANTSYNFNITITDDLSSAGMIKIYFPDTITPSLSSSCATLSGTGVISSPTCVYASGDKSIILTDMNSSSSDIGAQTLQVTVLEVINAPSTAPTGTFTVESYYTTSTDTLVSTGTISGVTPTIGTISSSTVEVGADSYVVLATGVTYTVSFVSTYEIPSGGFVEVTAPESVVLDYASVSDTTDCKYSTDSSTFAGTGCTATQLSNDYFVNFTTIAQGGAIAAGTNISLRVEARWTNPSSTVPVGSFTITTYSSDSYTIQSIDTGVSVEMLTPAPMDSITVSRDTDGNSELATYTIQLTQQPSMEASSYLQATFPSQVQLTASSTCTDLGGGALTCSHSSNVLTVELGASAIASLTSFGVIVDNVLNPPSFAVAGSDFSFHTQTPSQHDSYAESTFSYTQQTDTASLFSAISGTFSNRVYGESSNLEITFTPSSTRATPSSLVIVLASSFTVDSSLSCVSFVGITSGSCSSSTTHSVNVSGTFTSTSMTITISGFTTPESAPADYTIITSYDSIPETIDQSLTNIQFSVSCTLPCRTCTSTLTQCLSCYTNTDITTFIYLSTNQCVQTCSTGMYQDDSTYQCESCDGVCGECEGVSSNCIDCDGNSSYRYLNQTGSTGTCLTDCPIYYYPDTTQYPVLCVDCISPCSECSDVTTCLSCVDGFYFYIDDCESSCPTGTHIENDVTNECDACDSQCAQCEGTVDNCTSCSSSAALYNGSCVSSCPSPLVINNGECASCDSSCEQCEITYDNCTKCDTSSSLPYLHNYQCLDTCPQLYYEDGVNGECLECDLLGIGCSNCSSSSTCFTCDDDYVFLDDKCYADTPTGYANVSGLAKLCAGDCETCETLVNNCTSCKTLNLDGNDCVDPCPAGQVADNHYCVACTSPCKTCEGSQTNCTSCLSGLDPEVFLNNNICIDSCPSYTYANYSTNECSDCESPCYLCSSLSVCESCVSGYFYYNGTCEVDCPFGFIGIAKVCEACDSPCDGCQIAVDNCTSCIDGYYYVPDTNDCQLTCPDDLYPNDISYECQGCQSPCETCTNTSTTCLSCLVDNLFNNDCVSDCPDAYYPLNNECQPCSTGCDVCTSTSACSDCSFGYYLYQQECLTDCPSAAPVIDGNSTCVDCSDGNCLVCDSLDRCTECTYPYLLHVSGCVDECPDGFVNNGTDCNFDNSNNSSDDNTTTTVLEQTLNSSSVFPAPFVISGGVFGIACIMSKFQFQGTFVSGSMYSLLAFAEIASLATLTYFYLDDANQTTNTTSYSTTFNGMYRVGVSVFQQPQENLQAIIFFGGICCMYLLNLIALITQNCYLRYDMMFNRWLRVTSHVVAYYAISILGFLLTHKCKNLLFCKLFNFQVFKAKLESVHSFRVFNVFTFLSFIPSFTILYALIILLIRHINDENSNTQLMMAYIDTIVIVVLVCLFGVVNVCKAVDFFEEVDEDGVVINRRVTHDNDIMHEAMVAMMEDEDYGGNYKHDTEAKFHTQQESSSEAESQPSSMHLFDISIQAAPIVQDFDIKIVDCEQMTKENKIEVQENILNTVSDDISKKVQDDVENKIEVENDIEDDIGDQIDDRNCSVHSIEKSFSSEESKKLQKQQNRSLQNTPQMDDQGIQMSQFFDDAPELKNMSIQYSKQQNFENHSKTLIKDDDLTHSISRIKDQTLSKLDLFEDKPLSEKDQLPKERLRVEKDDIMIQSDDDQRDPPPVRFLNEQIILQKESFQSIPQLQSSDPLTQPQKDTASNIFESKILDDGFSDDIQDSRAEEDEEIIDHPIQHRMKTDSSRQPAFVKYKTIENQYSFDEDDWKERSRKQLGKLERMKSRTSEISEGDVKILNLREEKKEQSEDESPIKQLPRVHKSESKLKPVEKKPLRPQKPLQREILAHKPPVFHRADRYMQKHQNTKKRIKQIQSLQYPAGYMKDTYLSKDKKRKHSYDKNSRK